MKNLESITAFLSYSDFGIKTLYDDSVIELIKGFGNLPNGWDFGEGKGANSEVIKKALRLYRFGRLSGYNVSARPDPDGGIILGFSIDGNFLYITVKENNQFDVLHELGHGADYEILNDTENVDFDYIENLLNDIQGTWYSLGHLIYPGMIQPLEDSPLTASRIWEVAYPCSMKTAQEPQVREYATI